MQFWADGMPDDLVSTTDAHATRSGSSHELALEGELGATVDGKGVKGKGALRKTGGEESSTTKTHTTSMTRRGATGYVRDCADMANDWYMERVRAMQPYGE
jgi:hypothetical protein